MFSGGREESALGTNGLIHTSKLDMQGWHAGLHTYWYNFWTISFLMHWHLKKNQQLNVNGWPRKKSFDIL